MEWDHCHCSTCGTTKEQDLILVMPTFDPTNGQAPGITPWPEKSVAFHRYQLAIWDYESAWSSSSKGDDGGIDKSARITSISDAKRRMTAVLSSLKSSGEDLLVKRSQSPYKSSRERKAQTKAKIRGKKNQ